MKYLKLFDTESNYLAYRNNKSKYIKPNVSLSDDNGSVYYNFTPPPPDFNGHDYVDLGLPSGTLWATMNLGALKPTDYGKYFQWGDTQGYTADQVGTGDGQKKFARDWSDYKFGTNPNFTKYTTKDATLELEDDAAHANMGGSWHMPTSDQVQELINNVTTAWTTSNGVSGMTFTSKKDNSKSIFIPAAGYAEGGLVHNSKDNVYVWCSILNTDFTNMAQYLGSTSGYAFQASANRYRGFSVRGVID